MHSCYRKPAKYRPEPSYAYRRSEMTVNEGDEFLTAVLINELIETVVESSRYSDDFNGGGGNFGGGGTSNSWGDSSSSSSSSSSCSDSSSSSSSDSGGGGGCD